MPTRSALDALRDQFPKHNIGYYLVLSQDAHDSEYVAAADKRRQFICGFTGSAGTAVIGRDFAEFATDGRYYLQAEKELKPGWTLRKEGSVGVDPWYKALASRARQSGQNIGVDPRLISNTLVKEIQDALAGSSAQLVPVIENLVDLVWKDKPAEPEGRVFTLSNKLTGKSFDQKLEQLRGALRNEDARAIVLSGLDEIAWLFNLRGSDIKFNPVFKSYALVTNDKVALYVGEEKIAHVKAALPSVEFRPYKEVFDDVKAQLQSLKKSKEAGHDGEQKLWVPKGSSWALNIAAGGAESTFDKISPVQNFKAVKNSAELDGARLAQLKCGLSLVRYLSWLDRELAAGNEGITEYQGSKKLLEIRSKLDDFVGPSFETISSVGPNAAIIHYEPAEEGDKCINTKEVYLLDSGCQFLHGTTDTTRTVHFGTPSNEEREAYTLVLKGHISLGTRVFPSGTNGYQLDPIARQHLWKYGLDYRHGTGHGVGAFLNVHEGPMGIGSSNVPMTKVPLEVGNLMSNEPGFYKDGKFGIRIESLVVVKEADTPHRFGDRKYLAFDTITLVPLAINMIDTTLLDASEKEWVNKYHAHVREKLSPHLNREEREWLEKNTREI